jgi:hypothetical protein
VPARQIWPAAQAWPQPPQWAGLVAVLTQRALQMVEGAGQVMEPVQAPSWQIWPGRQTVPQVPQLR